MSERHRGASPRPGVSGIVHPGAHSARGGQRCCTPHSRSPRWRLLGATCALSSTAIAETAADIELVLAVDVSGSIDKGEQELERTSLAQAFRDPQVVDA